VAPRDDAERARRRPINQRKVGFSMALNPEWRDRITHWMRVLRKLCYIPLGGIEFEYFTTLEHLSPQQALTNDFLVIHPGDSWGKKWEYAWLRSTITLPDSAADEKILLHLDAGTDGLVWVDGVVRGGCDREHPTIPLSDSGIPGACIKILIEGWAGADPVRVTTGPVPYGENYLPDPVEGERRTLGTSTFGIWQEEVYQLLMDATVLWEVREKLDSTSLRANDIDRGLADMTLLADVEMPRADLLKGIQAARLRLAPLLTAQNGTTAPELHAFGHAHIDVAWLWPLAETERKVARTAANQLEILGSYSEYVFLQSQAQLYVMLRDRYPDIYDRVRDKVSTGQWNVEGSAWVEPDTNITGGESLIRQFIYGKRYFQEEFGCDTRIFWEPDVFGYSAALPQIMCGCGIPYFATQKIMWGYNDGDPFPYNDFVWQGIDGSQVLAHIFHGYGYETSPKHLIEAWASRAQKSGTTGLMLPFGYGDGGGGATREHLEYLRRAHNLEGVPRTRIAPPIKYFENLERRRTTLPQYVGELYFQAHRGTYTSQARTKLLNRRAETGLREAEFWTSMAAALTGFSVPLTELESAWKHLLTNQFHDILPGSSIGRVYEEAERDLSGVVALAGDVTQAATAALVTGSSDGAITVFNSLSFARSILLTLPAGDDRVTDAVGASLVTQRFEGQRLVEVPIPPCGWTTVRTAGLKDAAPGGSVHNAHSDALALNKDAGWILENDLIRATFNASGELASLWDKESSCEWMAAPGNVFLMYKDVPRAWDAWDIDSNYTSMPVALSHEARVEIVARGPLFACLRVTRQIHNSEMRQEVRLQRGSRRLDFVTTILWKEKHKLLKVAFPLAVHAEEALHEIQFGHVRRPNHASRKYDADRFEVPQQRWTALVEEGRGAAVLNDCKYGVNVTGNRIQLTLLKAAIAPDPHADEGMQAFTYSLTTWNGPFFDCAVVREAYELNAPLTVMVGAPEAPEASLFLVDASNVFIDTVKPAEDGSGDVIVRMYEAKRTWTRCRLHVALPVRQMFEADMLENRVRELDVREGQVLLEVRPFQILTLRIKVG